MKKLLSLLFVALTFSACEPATDDAPAAASEAGPHNFSAQVVYAVPASQQGATREERQEALLEAMEVYHGEKDGDLDLGHFLRSEASLSEKHEAAQAMLAEHSGDGWYFLEQMVAAPMLELTLNSPEVDRNLEAVEAYTRLLVQNENPSGDLIARALPLLREHWSPEEVRQSARVALESSQRWLAKQCAGCDEQNVVRPAAARADVPATLQGSRYDTIKEAIPVLERLSVR